MSTRLSCTPQHVVFTLELCCVSIKPMKNAFIIIIINWGHFNVPVEAVVKYISLYAKLR